MHTNHQVINITKNKLYNIIKETITKELFFEGNKQNDIIQIEHYKKAYNLGIEDSKTGNHHCWYTKALSIAYDLGYENIKVDFNKVVVAYRRGNIPPGGISYNYLDNRFEQGLSVTNIDCNKEIGSTVWFLDRKKVKVRGILLPINGSDGESLILPLDIEQYDY